jgi:CheY-like chemotaxis protein
MAKGSGEVLKDRVVLVVDDEADVVETIAELLGGCLVRTAGDYPTALQSLMSYTYDVVILDVMGVNGLELLKVAVRRGFPAVVLTAHAVSPQVLKKSIQYGAVCFLPKERMDELPSFLQEVVQGRPVWRRLFARMGRLFEDRFGAGWKERDAFLKEFVHELEGEGRENPMTGNER